ncbi:MAG: hypothetical protein WCP21_05765, partial [Armatimonadota bacterium]
SIVMSRPSATSFKVVADGLLITIDSANCSWSGDEEGSMEAAPDWPSGVLYEFLDAAIAGSNVTSVPYIEGVKSLAPSVAGYVSMERGGVPVQISELLGG